jgi:hypothetical protein
VQTPIPAGSVAGKTAHETAAPDGRLRGAWRSLKQPLLWITASVAFGWLLAIVWWAVLSPDARDSGITDELVIPPGTAEAIRTGTGASFVPGQVSLRPGSRLVVRNDDTEEHLIGNAVIPPGAVAELTAPESGEGFYCTIHPSGFLGVDIDERPHFASTIVPALLVGLPLGIVVAGASYVGRRLDLGSEDDGDGSDGPSSAAA